MAKLASEIKLGNLATYVYPTGTYDANKLGVPSLMVQRSGALPTDNWAGPIPPAIARPVESSAAIPGVMPFVLNWSETEDWIFLADNAAAAATRRLQMYKFNRITGAFAWKGFVTLNFPFAGTQGTYTIRAFRMIYDKYTTGTASASGTSVTGVGTAWATSRLPVGVRIGFGSTDPSVISTWYEISAVGSDTGITLTTNAGTISSGAYVIEDLRGVVLMTNAVTTTNGGLFSVKGLSHDAFGAAGTSIPAATTVDSIRAVYWHTDAGTNTNIVGLGMGIQQTHSWTEHNVYVLDTIANPVSFKFNVRASLTPTAGKDTNAFVLKTGSGGVLTGTPSQTNNARIAICNHGPGAGLECMYFTTASRIYRTADVSTFSSGSTTWLSGGDVMTEIPPGGSTTQAAFATLSSIEYASQIDKFIISTTSAAGGRHYISRYRTDGGQIDRVFLIDTRQTNQSTASIGIPPVPSTMTVAPTIWSEGGIAFMATTGTTAVLNFLYAFPTGADWEYINTSNQRLILPKMNTVGALAYSTVATNFMDVHGGTTGNNLGLPTEGLRLVYRTTGIDDNTGGWNTVDESGNLDGIAGADYIQFAVEFKCIGLTCLPSRLYSVVLTYNDFSTDSHYQPSVGNSDVTAKRFAWRFSSSFGGTVPTLNIKLFNAITGFLLNEDDSVTQDGTWEKSTDGGDTWTAYNNTDKTNDITYIRYTPSSLVDNVMVRALITTQ